MLSPVVQGALNEQITTELFSSYNYLAMSAFCERQNFRGCAQWLRVQSQEEYAHAMKLYDFLLARNGKVELKAIQAPRTDYDSIPQVFAETLKQEEEVSRRIDQLYELAFKEKAFAALVQLQWFITQSRSRLAGCFSVYQQGKLLPSVLGEEAVGSPPGVLDQFLGNEIGIHFILTGIGKPPHPGKEVGHSEG